jgi:hypothetical protein
MDHYTRKAVSDELKKWCYFAGDEDHIEVCAWVNDEGYDVQIASKALISLTRGELHAITTLVAMMDRGE